MGNLAFGGVYGLSATYLQYRFTLFKDKDMRLHQELWCGDIVDSSDEEEARRRDEERASGEPDDNELDSEQKDEIMSLDQHQKDKEEERRWRRRNTIGEQYYKCTQESDACIIYFHNPNRRRRRDKKKKPKRRIREAKDLPQAKHSPWQSQQSLLRMYEGEDSAMLEASAGRLHGMLVRDRQRQKTTQKTRGRKPARAISSKERLGSEHDWTHGEFDPLQCDSDSLSRSQKRKRMFSQQEIVYHRRHPTTAAQKAGTMKSRQLSDTHVDQEGGAASPGGPEPQRQALPPDAPSQQFRINCSLLLDTSAIQDRTMDEQRE